MKIFDGLRDQSVRVNNLNTTFKTTDRLGVKQ
jgi:hypothetical protein